MTIAHANRHTFNFANINKQKLLQFSVLFSLSIFLIGLTTFIFSLKSSPTEIASESVVNAAVISSSTPKNLISEMNIAKNGFVFIRNARVVAISDGNKLDIAFGWGSTQFLWRVETNDKTIFINNEGVRLKASSLKVGDVTFITGNLQTNDSTPVVVAEAIRIL